MKTPMKKVLAAIVAAIGLAAFAEPTVKFNKVKLANPRTGEISCTYTTSGFKGKPYDLVIEVGAEGAESKTVTVKHVGEGTETRTIDVKTLLGKAYPDVTLFAELKEDDVGVQLWANGPYFAKCNVGATKPEEYGYYFWWGDTEGYVRNAADNGWVSAKDGTTTIQFDAKANQTYEKDNATLLSEGWIDASGNLTMAHDAARAYLGGDWRMPTSAEIQALVDNTTRTWTDNWNGTGVAGYIVTGKDEYADQSLFFPAAGFGSGSTFYYAGSYGYYWSSTPHSDNPCNAWSLYFYSGNFDRYGSYRSNGRSVRPVRGFAE